MAQGRERIPSAAKAEVARNKPRDNAGRFLSGAELQQYMAMQQQQQFDIERAKVNAMLGRREQQQPGYSTSPITPNIPQPRDNFNAILNANKPGVRSNTNIPQDGDDRWNILLGKKRNGNNGNRW
jgi:hypothetical protein